MTTFCLVHGAWQLEAGEPMLQPSFGNELERDELGRSYWPSVESAIGDLVEAVELDAGHSPFLTQPAALADLLAAAA